MVFKKGHKRYGSGMLGKKHSQKTKDKIGLASKGRTHSLKTKTQISNTIKAKELFAEKNPNWKGNDVGYHGIHAWIKRRKPKPEFCELCNKNNPFDLANKSGEYKRDLDDWYWICRSCHTKSDNRISNIRKMRRDSNSN